MPSVTPSVFISYRREDCPGHAGRLFDHLRARFGGASLFMDVTDIEAGVDFTDVLQRAVGSCDVLLAVVGREWLTCTDRNGRRRLDDPNDFIRLEIGIALARNVRVIPVLVEGAAMPTASELPSDLEGLAKRQAVELRDARWSADVDNLADVLDRVLGPRAAAIESSSPRPGRGRLWALGAIALVAAGIGVVTLLPRSGSTPSAPPQSASGAPTVAEQRPPVEAQPATPSAPEPEAKKIPAAPISPAREVPTELAPPKPPPSPRPANGFLGVRMANLAPSSRGGIPRGAIVQSLATGGPAADAGLLVGDLIVEYGGTTVKDAADFNRLTSASAPGDTVAIGLRRDGVVRTLEVVVGDRANAPGVMGTVSIHYAAADDQKIAAELATALRETINDPRYAIRTLRASRNAGSEGEVRYSASRWSALAGTLAQSAGASLSKTYGRRVVFAPLVDVRVIATSVVVVMPGRTLAPVAPLPDPIITVAYANPADARTAEALADFLRTLRSGWKYSVRTEQKVSGPMAGQIEYDNERMGELAQILARESSAWISRAYRRPVVLQPASRDRIRGDLIILWLPSR